MGMHRSLERIKALSISRERQHRPNFTADNREISEYRTLSGTLNFLGQAVLPQACYVASQLQKRLGHLTIAHLMDGNEMLGDLSALEAHMTLCRSQEVASITVCTLSDASHGKLTASMASLG